MKRRKILTLDGALAAAPAPPPDRSIGWSTEMSRMLAKSIAFYKLGVDVDHASKHIGPAFAALLNGEMQLFVDELLEAELLEMPES
jgi:hypothetical protein